MAFSFSKLMVAASVATGALLSLTGQANAIVESASSGFGFTTQYTGDAPKGDIWLESVTVGEQIIEDFSYVSKVKIRSNDTYTGGNSGAASADIGDNATTGIKVEGAESADIVTNLQTNNLNNIIDTEDKGNFVLDLIFDKAIDNVLVWERGMNSDLQIQALDNKGNLIGTAVKITRDMWFEAGYAIDTQEIGKAQDVGSLGLNVFADLGIESGYVEKLRFTSESRFNGPDWKIVGTDAHQVPEPAFLLGLGMVGGLFMLQKRNRVA